jgi:hypothetical protein
MSNDAIRSALVVGIGAAIGYLLAERMVKR